MTYQKDQTGILQSATKAAAEMTAAELGAGIIKSHETAVKRFEELRATILEPLEAARTADNEMFKAEEASAPAKTASSGGNRSGGKSGGKASGPITDAGSVVIKGGKFDTLTVSDVYDMPASLAEDYGYCDRDGSPKPGSKYIQWLTTNDKNPFMQKVAKTFLESKRAGSDS